MITITNEGDIYIATECIVLGQCGKMTQFRAIIVF